MVGQGRLQEGAQERLSVTKREIPKGPRETKPRGAGSTKRVGSQDSKDQQASAFIGGRGGYTGKGSRGCHWLGPSVHFHWCGHFLGAFEGQGLGEGRKGNL